MPSEIFNQFYSSTWNPSPIQRTNEPHVVTAGFFVLNYIPDPDEGVQISLGATPLYENKFNQTISNVNQYVVDYNSGAVYVDISLNGQQLTVTNYWALGLIKIYASRVELQDGTTGQDIGQTLQEFVDSIKAYTYQGEYDNSKLYEANMQVLYEGSTYIAIQSTLGHSPINTTYWRPFASGFVYKGDYSNSTQYYIRDVVSYNYGLYLCIAVPTIGTSPSNTSYWKPMFDASTIIQNAVDATTNANNCRYLGDYNGSTNYKINNIVKYNLSLYICKLDSTGNIPTNTTYWDESTKTFSWKDAYDGSTSYKVLDVVYYLGSSYVCKLDSTGNIPTNTTYWSPMALKGEKGATLSPRGAYDNAETYLVNDLVSYNGSTWTCKTTSTGNAPVIGSSYWDIFVLGGGTVTEVSSANSDISVTNGTTTPVLTLNSSTTKAVNKIVKRDSSGNIVDLGDISSLTTTDKISTVNAVNEVNSNTNTALSNIGTLSNLNTSNKTNLVNATNEVNSNFTSHLVDYSLQIPYGGVTTNSGNNYSSSTPTISILSEGMAISIKINADSTGATTFNWNSKGAKSIKRANGYDVTNLKNGGIYTLRYDGTNFVLQGEGGSGNATAPDLLSGKTASTDAGDITGTLDLSNLIAENIKKGITINGVVGSVLRSASGTLSGNNTDTITINSLTFQPSKVFFGQYNSSTTSQLYLYYNGVLSRPSGSVAPTWTMNSNGFTIVTGNFSSANTYAWLALE